MVADDAGAGASVSRLDFEDCALETDDRRNCDVGIIVEKRSEHVSDEPFDIMRFHVARIPPERERIIQRAFCKSKNSDAIYLL